MLIGWFYKTLVDFIKHKQKHESPKKKNKKNPRLNSFNKVVSTNCQCRRWKKIDARRRCGWNMPTGKLCIGRQQMGMAFSPLFDMNGVRIYLFFYMNRAGFYVFFFSFIWTGVGLFDECYFHFLLFTYFKSNNLLFKCLDIRIK